MQPTFLSNGTTPLPTDTKWILWVRILSTYQNLPGAKPANDPRPTDSLWTIIDKLAKAAAGV